ncbi:MAG: acyclic terpene utilization AtuA family protein [Pikeienuella sp.]
MKQPVIIGGASGFWGEADYASAQLLAHPGLNYLVYDYLAEVTMSIMARARAKNADMGYAVDFISAVMAPNLATIADKGVQVLSNAGGVNPTACAAALQAEISRQGLSLKVAVVEGDDLIARKAEFAEHKEMFSGEVFPNPDKVASVNAYLGAGPIIAALDAGADIVVTGRVTDSALALAAAAHHFGWGDGDYDLLAAGSLVGHLLECGPQSTGGNFTDWRDVGDISDIGYPIAEVSADGSFVISKPDGTGGIVSRATVAEQMLYEIGNPQSYLLPDVACDFSEVEITEIGVDRVHVSGTKGRAPSGKLKVSVTYMDGFRAGHVFQFSGAGAREKAQSFMETGIARARKKLRAMNAPDFDEVVVETHGGRPGDGPFEEITAKAAVKHTDARAVGLFLKETIGAALATPPGLHFFTAGGRPKPSPVLRLFSFLIDAGQVPVIVTVDGVAVKYTPAGQIGEVLPEAHAVPVAATDQQMRVVRLEELACARSGDKGDSANIGVIARRAEYLPWIWQSIDEAAIAAAFAAFSKGEISRFYLPGTAAMNILMSKVLGGGGVASLLNDPQGKAYGQILLNLPVEIPAGFDV